MNIEELYRTYFDIVYRYIRSVSRDGALAEEVTQETFFKALKKADQFRPSEKAEKATSRRGAAGNSRKPWWRNF